MTNYYYLLSLLAMLVVGFALGHFNPFRRRKATMRIDRDNNFSPCIYPDCSCTTSCNKKHEHNSFNDDLEDEYK